MVHFEYLRQMCRVKGDVYESYGGRNYQRDRRDRRTVLRRGHWRLRGGGLEALQDFFKAMPADTGAAFVVVQHLSRYHNSLMAELLSRCTTMTVKASQDSHAGIYVSI